MARGRTGSGWEGGCRPAVGAPRHQPVVDHIGAADRVVLLLNTLLLMVVAFLPFATSVLAGALHSGHGERTAVVFYSLAFDSPR